MVNRNILYSLDDLALNSKIAIYGSGKIGAGFKKLIEEDRSDLQVFCFIDTFKSGRRDGTKIIKLADLEIHKSEFDIIVVASSLWNQIEDDLNKLGCEHYLISNELMYGTLDIRSLGSFRFSDSNREEIAARLTRVRDYFEGDDREYFDLLINLRVKEDESEIFNFLKSADEKFSTAYLDHVDKDFNKKVILEGGVADGTDSVRFYEFFNNKDLKIYGFEPFIETFELNKNMGVLKNKGMEIFPYALWNEDKDLIFNKNEFSANTSSVIRNDISENPVYTKVKGVTIDSFVKDYGIDSINLFKLDIEGAEMEALQGAKEMIRRYKPQLAICIYHKKEHLYEIPELLKELHPGYTFKLGFYSPTFIDTVLYALP